MFSLIIGPPRYTVRPAVHTVRSEIGKTTEINFAVRTLCTYLLTCIARTKPTGTTLCRATKQKVPDLMHAALGSCLKKQKRSSDRWWCDTTHTHACICEATWLTHAWLL